MATGPSDRRVSGHFVLPTIKSARAANILRGHPAETQKPRRSGQRLGEPPREDFRPRVTAKTKTTTDFTDTTDNGISDLLSV
jgi:hypothetical protein